MRRLYCVGLAVLFTLGLLAVLSFFPWGPVKVVRVVGHVVSAAAQDIGASGSDCSRRNDRFSADKDSGCSRAQ